MNEGFRARKVFVIGAGRSGTTILLRGLACVRGVTTVPRLGGAVASLSVPAALLRRLRLLPNSWAQPSGEGTALFNSAGLTQELRLRLGRAVTVSDVEARALRRMGARLDRIGRIDRADVVAVKSTAATTMVPVLADSFPDAAFIVVAREPSRVVMSLLLVPFWRGMPLRWDGRTAQDYAAEEGLSEEVVAARHWTNQMGQALTDLERLEPERWCSVDYDDFTHQPEEVLARLGRWLGLAGSVDGARVCGLRMSPGGSRVHQEVPAEVSGAVDQECLDVWRRTKAKIE